MTSLRAHLFFPFYHSGTKATRILKLVGTPLCTSLYTTSIALNILIFIVYTKVSRFMLYSAYLSGLFAPSGFILFVLAIIYGNYIFLTLGTCLEYISTILQVLIIYYLWTNALEGVDLSVFLTIKVLLLVFIVISLVLNFRLLFITMVLADEMYKKGVYWDIDDVLENTRHKDCEVDVKEE